MPFRHTPRHGIFFDAGSNAEARAWLARPQDWPDGRIALWGARGCGKTHLLGSVGFPVLAGRALDSVPPSGDLAIDDADAVPEPRLLLHLLNACAESGCRVVLAGRTPPARWSTGLADLDSRLRALLAVPIGPPEDSLLEALLRHLLAERQLAMPQALQDWLRLRLPRTAHAMREAAARLDEASLRAGTRIGRAIAAEVLAQLAPHSPGDEDLLSVAPFPSSAAQDVR